LIWDASSWATDGEKYKENYSYEPFLSTYTNFITIAFSPILKDEHYHVDYEYCNSHGKIFDCLISPKLNKYQIRVMDLLWKNYMTYDYCQHF